MSDEYSDSISMVTSPCSYTDLLSLFTFDLRALTSLDFLGFELGVLNSFVALKFASLTLDFLAEVSGFFSVVLLSSLKSFSVIS